MLRWPDSPLMAQMQSAGPRAFNGLCDDEGMPLIRPTCQVFAQSTSVPATACYFAWGCFRYFWLGAQLRRDILLEAAHSSEACSWSSATSKVAATRSRAVLAGGLARPALCSRSGRSSNGSAENGPLSASRRPSRRAFHRRGRRGDLGLLVAAKRRFMDLAVDDMDASVGSRGQCRIMGNDHHGLAVF